MLLAGKIPAPSLRKAQDRRVIIEEEADPETRAEMARQLSEVFDVEGDDA